MHIIIHTNLTSDVRQVWQPGRQLIRSNPIEGFVNKLLKGEKFFFRALKIEQLSFYELNVKAVTKEIIENIEMLVAKKWTFWQCYGL